MDYATVEFSANRWLRDLRAAVTRRRLAFGVGMMLGRRVLLCATAATMALMAVLVSDARPAGSSRTELSDWTKPRKPHGGSGRGRHGSSAGTKQAKLVKWAEAHGMPKSLAQNPKDKAKVKSIIARMKADLVVERLKKQMKADDHSVTNIMHMSDPNAAGVGR